MANNSSYKITHTNLLLLVEHRRERTMTTMALTSVHCYPLLKPSLRITPSSVSARTPVLRRTRRPLQRCFCSQYADERQPRESPQQLERLFSNLNQATMKHEPGSVTSAIFLVAGTTVLYCTISSFILLLAVGAGILAIPAVTQEAGFLASAVTCIFCWLYMVVTGLLVAEVNVNTMCELGSGGVSLVSMAMRTLGTFGVRTACLSYLFIHYALLVAYVARSSDIITNSLGIPFAFELAFNDSVTSSLKPLMVYYGYRWESATLFSLAFGGISSFGSQRLIGAVNGFLVVGILTSFTSLVVVASGNLQWSSLLEANFAAAPQSIPIIALSFVYQNVVPVLCTNLEGDLSRVRTAIVAGTAIPLALFLIWDAVILGTLPDLAGSSTVSDPLELLRSSNGIVGPIVEAFSFLAIGTSYIGFVLGLSDFLADLFKLPSGQNKPLPYILTLLPPLVLSMLDPEIFFKALDFAGTYGGKDPFTVS
ncbi:hypothetical protein BAE44_0005606 [Dichanthelium oligosanthes]|uniref:Tyrosine-specific transport protein n=1 Tax=Dichanthelium oligosanthes TaxID=888268 RepID=A0A1E5W7D5_9POAL|nr:hypothetical protein BAE44_0005606 [Dichanthelium oligosanthes]